MYDPYYDARVASEIVQHALAVDPGNHVTLTAEKARRLSAAFDAAVKRVEECEDALRKIEGQLQAPGEAARLVLGARPSDLAQAVAMLVQEHLRLKPAQKA